MSTGRGRAADPRIARRGHGRLRAEPYAEIIASWAVGYERRLRGLGSGALTTSRSPPRLPKRSRDPSPEQSASARAILVGHWRDRILVV